LARPKLLLLDEPTAGLDVATRRDVWSWMQALASAGCGIVISTHDLAEAERCPSILLYHNGTAHPQTAPAEFAASVGAATLEDAVLHIAGEGAA
jgi:ABC-type multidrug transport system ATPase subunit